MKPRQGLQLLAHDKARNFLVAIIGLASILDSKPWTENPHSAHDRGSLKRSRYTTCNGWPERSLDDVQNSIPLFNQTVLLKNRLLQNDGCRHLSHEKGHPI